MIKKLTDIVIDPGHGGADCGAVWGYTQEDDLNLAIAGDLAQSLSYMGSQVVMTRRDDVTVTLHDRVRVANILDARAFISIHCDAFHNTTASGMSVHICPGSKKGRALADHVCQCLLSAFPGHYHRGIIESDFYVLKHTRMPAVLVECEFLSNPTTRNFLRDPGHQSELAIAIARGVFNADI
jgi:N-acetylmuramoyl-L-alanine amidase